MNVDLCFVPATHAETEAVPAVSGSSGRLVVSPPKAGDGEPDWPGRVFERADLSYPEAMEQFVAKREAAGAAATAAGAAVPPSEPGEANQKAVRRALRAEEQRLRVERGQARERRRVVDAGWARRRREHEEALAALKAETKRRERGRKRVALRAQYRAEWAERHQELARRREAAAAWRDEREALRQRQHAVGVGQVVAWIAVLVIVDNCTRRGLGLPLFVLGVHVTAEVVVEALKALLPKGLQYLIADGGAHFAGTALKRLAQAQGFVRVPLAKHRPESNGIAERFVETLKAWLADKEWQTAEELAALLRKFLVYYNDRPHQGRELAGLSPNEYAKRLVAV